jgi:hypothetical protein
VSNVRISWNEKAIEQAKAQALEHAFSEIECSDCGTNRGSGSLAGTRASAASSKGS